MHAWPAPHVPVLPGRGHPLRLHDTSGASVRPTTPGPTATIYVCGITPYDATHLGHAATYITFDLVNRLWRDAGHDVRYVQNVTDIDDPLLERATATGVGWEALAAEQTQLFRDDMTWLRVIPPTEYIGAVESIPLVSDMITELAARGAVYDVEGDLYFSIRSDPAFGAVSGFSDDTMRALFAERGGDPDRPGKKDPLDSLLWRHQRPDEPAWDSPHGRGRPGWHVECTAIAVRHLGMGFDVQGGGSDLVFPHHEMCASVGHVATGSRPFAHTYAHAGMVGYDGEKMSKSLGNLVLASRLRADGASPADVRLALLADHYRADREWTDDTLATATARRRRWSEAVQVPTASDASELVESVRLALTDDLDTPTALALIDAWADSARTRGGIDPTAGNTVRTMVDALLGIDLA